METTAQAGEIHARLRAHHCPESACLPGGSTYLVMPLQAAQERRDSRHLRVKLVEDWLAFGRIVASGLLTLVIAIALHYALSVLLGLG